MNSVKPRFVQVPHLLLAGCILAALAGCAPRADVGGPRAANDRSADPSAVTLRLADADVYERTIAQHRGKVVLVDFWATWCLPCVEQFPHTIALDRQYRDRGLAVVAVSLNDPDEEPQVRAFLESRQARFDNLLSRYERSSEAVQAFNLPGPIPAYRVYDRTGELRHQFAVDPKAQRQFTPEDIEAAVLELL